MLHKIKGTVCEFFPQFHYKYENRVEGLLQILYKIMKTIFEFWLNFITLINFFLNYQKIGFVLYSYLWLLLQNLFICISDNVLNDSLSDI